MQNETWKPLLGYEELYQVSSMGRIFGIKSKRFLKPFVRAGYHQCTLSVNGVNHLMRYNRAVALTFIPNPENKPEVNHKNGVKSDNRVENLEWCTTSENIKHAYDTGLKKAQSGADNRRSKPVYQFTLDGVLVRRYNALKEAARINGYGTIINIRQCCMGMFEQRYGYRWSYKETLD